MEVFWKSSKEVAESVKRYKNSYETTERRKNKFKIGDILFYYDPTTSINKLETRWRERGIVIEVFNGGYRIKTEEGRVIKGNEKHFQKCS